MGNVATVATSISDRSYSYMLAQPSWSRGTWNGDGYSRYIHLGEGEDVGRVGRDVRKRDLHEICTRFARDRHEIGTRSARKKIDHAMPRFFSTSVIEKHFFFPHVQIAITAVVPRAGNHGPYYIKGRVCGELCTSEAGCRSQHDRDSMSMKKNI